MEKVREIKKLQEDKAKAKQRANWKEVGLICNYLGDLFAGQGDYEEALDEHRQELDCFRKLNDELGVAVAYRRLGECHSELDQFASALNFQQKYLDIVRKLANQVEIQRAWATLGRTYFMQYSSDPKRMADALSTAEEAHLKALNLTEKYGISSQSVQNPFDQFVQVSLIISVNISPARLKSELKERDYAEMRCRAYLNLGLIYEQKEDEKECSNCFNIAINYAKCVFSNF